MQPRLKAGIADPSLHRKARGNTKAAGLPCSENAVGSVGSDSSFLLAFFLEYITLSSMGSRTAPPSIEITDQSHDSLSFTMKNCDLSIANALRRILIAEVFGLKCAIYFN